jgi:hypothetical protein
MTILYIIDKNNIVTREGNLDPKIFTDEFQKEILPKILNEYPSFVTWVRHLYEQKLHKRKENSFADGFGTWFINKIGEKGVDKTLSWAYDFEQNYEDSNIESKPALASLLEFLVCNYKNEEKEFIEYNSVRNYIQSETKKILKKAQKIKKEAIDKLSTPGDNIKKENK